MAVVEETILKRKKTGATWEERARVEEGRGSRREKGREKKQTLRKGPDSCARGDFTAGHNICSAFWKESHVHQERKNDQRFVQTKKTARSVSGTCERWKPVKDTISVTSCGFISTASSPGNQPIEEPCALDFVGESASPFFIFSQV